MMIACLLTLALSCVGLALVSTSAYWLLMLLRCLQATGSASTIALGMQLVDAKESCLDADDGILGAGIIADITTPDERAGFFGLFGVGALVSDFSLASGSLENFDC